MLTNTGGFFFAKGFAAEFDSLKPLLTLTGSSEVSLERGGTGRREEAAHAFHAAHVYAFLSRERFGVVTVGTFFWTPHRLTRAAGCRSACSWVSSG